MLITDMSNWTSALAVLAADVPMDSFVLYIGKNNLAAKAPTNILQRDLHHDPPFLL